MSLLQVRNTSISCLFTRRDIFPKNSNGTVISFLVERSFSFFLFINNNNNNNNNNDEQMTVNDEGPQNKSEHKCCENKETMQKDTKLETPGRDVVEGYWIKNLSSIHERVSSQMNREDDLPEQMTHGHTVLFQKDPQKGNITNNYYPLHASH